MDKIPAKATAAKVSLAQEMRVSESSDHNLKDDEGHSGILGKAIYFLWHFHKKLVISLIVLSALILMGLRGAAFYIESHPEKMEALFESFTGNKIHFSDIKVDINPLFPSVFLKKITILNRSETEDLLKFEQAKIDFNVWRSLWQGRVTIEAFKLDGISTIIRRDPDGRFFLGNLLLSDSTTDNAEKLNFSKGFLSFLAQPVIQITHSEFYIVDQLNKIPAMLFHDINIKLQNQGNRHQISAEVSLNNTDTRVELRMDFTGDIDAVNKWDGTIYTAVESLRADHLQHLLGEDVLQVENLRLTDFDLSTRIWASISQGLLHTIRGEISIQDANLYSLDTDRSLLVDQLSADILIDRSPGGKRHPQHSGDWNTDLNNIRCKIGTDVLTLQRINAQYRASECSDCNSESEGQGAVPQLQLYVDSLDFSRISPVVQFFSPLDVHEQFYSRLKPEGQIKDSYAMLTLDSLSMPIKITDFQLQTSLRHFGLNAVNKIPEVRNFSADLQINKQSGYAEIDSHDMTLHVSSLFRDAWPITDLNGTFEWQKEGSDWLLQGKNLSVGNEHLQADADVKLWVPQAGSKRDIFMDLSVFYHDANIAYTSMYLPVTIMTDGLVHWLDNAIVSGRGTDGGALFRGRFGGFPFTDYSGHLDIVFNVKDATLDYMQGWPQLENLQSRIQFTTQGMWAESSYSKILGAVSKNAKVNIKHFKQPVLRVTGDLTGRISDGRAFLKQSQLGSEAILEAIEGEGNIGINLDLSKPLKKAGADTRVRVSLKDVYYFPPYLKKKRGLVDKLSGEIIVHNKSISSNKLQARIMGQPAQVKISSTLPAQSKEARINIRVDSRTSVQKLYEYEILPGWIHQISSYLNGLTGVSLEINLPHQGKNTRVKVSSSLKGLSSRLPFPLGKKAAEIKKLELSLSPQQNHTVQLKVDYADQIAAAMLMDTRFEPDKLIKAHIHSGKGNATLPKTAQILLTGVIDGTRADAWISLFAEDSTPRSGNKTTALKTLSTQIRSAGKISYPLPIQLALSKLVLPDLFESESTESGNPRKKAVKTLKKQQGYTAPEEFPTINGTIRQLYTGKVLVGEAEIRSVRLRKSIHYKHFSVAGDWLDFKGNAIWSQWKGQPKFNMEAQLHIPSLENALKQVGISDFIEGTESTSSGSIGWPGGPTDFNKEKIVGQIKNSFKQGRLLSTKPGTTRNLLDLLNLLNMNEIFRRITLDFSDVSNQGFEFTSLGGDFSLREGNAYTDNYVLIAPSLILISSGRLGLVKQDIDMTIIAIPDVSAALPLAGAAVAGPAGAAVVWVGQKIIGDKINEITALEYKVTGSWNNPLIEKQLQRVENVINKVKNINRSKHTKKISGMDQLEKVMDGFLD